MNWLILIPYLLGLLGIFARVSVPFWTKKAQDNDLSWSWNEALPPILGGAFAYLAMIAGGVFEGVTWQAALFEGLFGTVATAGAGDILKMGVRIVQQIRGS